MTQKKLITATYKVNTEWVLDHDIDDAFHWYIKWDTLNVMWNEGDSFQTYEPDFSGADNFDYKRPDEVDVEDYPYD
tara:strand:+ start:313 stop:540 length:228 start_codon:yes stop_codon:yes gene_type:complete